MSLTGDQLTSLRKVINENLRVQRGGADPVPYIDVSNALADINSRQNHTVFGRRGCGKTLLLQHSSKKVKGDVKTVYLNCEDFKHHSFPNVLIEILDSLFVELEIDLVGRFGKIAWYGKKNKSRVILRWIRDRLHSLRDQEDEQRAAVVESHTTEAQEETQARAGVGLDKFNLDVGARHHSSGSSEIELRYARNLSKLTELNKLLPDIKRRVRELFNLSGTMKAVFLQLDDYYHLARPDQPYVMDYVHRLCKDLPLYFKVATLRHVSTLYADREGQPIGAQERHDYQPVNIDFTFADFRSTVNQNRKIFHEFAKLAHVEPKEIDSLFKGEGFDRLIMAGGGVPRDCLSLFLEVVADVGMGSGGSGDRIGKDDVRIISRSNFERRIEELKQDSEGSEQATLIRGIYVLRKFCIEKKTNVMMVPEEMMQQKDEIRALLYRLLDYRIIHSAGTALTHKSAPGTYQAFAIDIGCYAHMRKLRGRFNEIDLSEPGARETMRSAPILTADQFGELWQIAPEDAEKALRQEDEEAPPTESVAAIADDDGA